MLTLENNMHLAELNSHDPGKVAETLGMRIEELAELAGLECNELQPFRDRKGGTRPRNYFDLVKVLRTIGPRFDSMPEAMDWFRNESLPGFNRRTGKQLVQEGRSQQFLQYIDAVDSGIHA